MNLSRKLSVDKKICIVGTGGFGRETLCCLLDQLASQGIFGTEHVCFMVGDTHYKEQEVMGVEVIPQSQFNPTSCQVVIAIGDPMARRKVVGSLPANTTYATLIHPSAVISQWVEIGEGSIVTAGCIITCNIRIGKHAHLNLHTTVGHDCVIGDFFTSAPAANISGNCHFGEEVYIGTNAAVKQGVNLCSGVTIGMGGLVVKNITEPGVYVGSPVKKMDKK
jgi:sugar O-acyltransferase (sialic acid O-acetyltransferase NeuD family)